MKKYLAFDGQTNTGFGAPNKRTGLHNTYGNLYAFNSKVERDAFCNEYSHRFNTYPMACNKKTARRYFWGMSVRDYNEQLRLLYAGIIGSM